VGTFLRDSILGLVESVGVLVGNTPLDHCGLGDFPVSRSTREILGSVTRDTGPRPNQVMILKAAIDPEGRISDLRVLRLAWSALRNSRKMNEDAIASMRRWLHTGRSVQRCKR